LLRGSYVNRHISPVDQCQYEDFFEVDMPVNWNGRFFFQGGGGQEGAIPSPSGVTNANGSFGLVNGYAVATQDGGHLNSELALPTCGTGYGNPNEFFLDPLGTVAFAYQSIEVTTLVAKYLINQFYGNGTSLLLGWLFDRRTSGHGDVAELSVVL
jgi:hypothetical protein